jgi:hypothetical protein
MNLMSVGERETKPQGREKNMKKTRLVRVEVDVEVAAETDHDAEYVAGKAVRWALEFAKNSDLNPPTVESAMVTDRYVITLK